MFTLEEIAAAGVSAEEIAEVAQMEELYVIKSPHPPPLAFFFKMVHAKNLDLRCVLRQVD